MIPQALPDSVVARVRHLMSVDPGQVWRLTFASAESDQPLLSDVIRRFGLDVNILHGQVDEIQGRPFGLLSVFARGARDQLGAAIDYLRQAGVGVKEVAHV